MKSAVESSRKSAMIQDTVRYTLAQNAVHALGVVNSVALRRFLGPSAMGLWSILQVILGYAGYASLGTTKTLARDYPYFLGKGEHERAGALKDLVLTFSMLGSFVPAVLILLYLAGNRGKTEPWLAAGLVFLAGFLFVQRYYDFLLGLLRSEKKFGVLSRLIVVNAAAGLAGTFLLVSRWQLGGLYAATTLVTLGCILYLHRTSPYCFRFRWDAPALWGELRVGLPLLAASFLFEFLKSLDKWCLAAKLGFYEVGLYSIAMMVSSYVYSMPMMFAHVWYPHLQEAYAREGDRRAVLGRFLARPMQVLSLLVPLASGAAIFLTPWLAHAFLPKFLPGLPAMKIYLVGTYFVMLGQYSGSILVTLDKQLVNLPILALACGVNAILNLSFIRLGWGLSGVAWGTAVSFAVYGLLSYAVAMRHVAETREALAEALEGLVVFAVLFGAVFVIGLAVPEETLLGPAVLKVLLLLACSIPFFWMLEKKMGLVGEILRTLKNKTPR
jgi:O-antigen/teichoic acid export membrane protein